MSDPRQPWLRPAGSASVPYVAALPQAERAPAAAQPWRQGARPITARAAASVGAGATATAAAAAVLASSAAACPGCAELADLKSELDDLRVEAIELGRRDGLAQTQALRDQLAAAIAAVERASAARDDAMCEQIVDVALGLCAELAPAAAAIDRRGLVQLVARSLRDAGGARELQLQVCAEDAAAIGTQLPAGMNCTVRPDLVPGEVWVEAPRLVVDGRWHTRLAALREPLLALVREPAFELATPRPAAPAVEVDE